MNQRIQELIKEATISRVITGPEVFTTPPIYFDKEKFAELLIRECLFIIDDERKPDMVNRTELWKQVKQHFGVE